MGFDPAPFFANLILAHKEADLVKARRNLGTVSVQKIKFFLVKLIQRHQ